MEKLLYCVFSLICCFGMVADVGVLARALNPNGLLGKGRIYFYDRRVCDEKKRIFILEIFNQIKFAKKSKNCFMYVLLDTNPISN